MSLRRILLIASSLSLSVTATIVVAPTRHLEAQVSARSQQNQAEDKDRAKILNLLSTQQADWNRGDVDAFMSAYWHSPEVSFSGTSGTIRGWDSVLARYKKTYANRDAMGQLEFSQLEFRSLGPDAYLLLGHWHLTRTKDDDVSGVFSLVWRRFPEGWRIIHDHTSAVPEVK